MVLLFLMIHAHQFCPYLGDAVGLLNYAALFCHRKWSPGNKLLSITGSNLLGYLCVHECHINSSHSKGPIPKVWRKPAFFQAARTSGGRRACDPRMRASSSGPVDHECHSTSWDPNATSAAGVDSDSSWSERMPFIRTAITGCSTRTWASQYRQNKIPFLNDVYLSLLSILSMSGDTFP
jgi:hypothetical protein